MNNKGARDYSEGEGFSISDRTSKVHITDFASLPSDLSWYKHLSTMIPKILRGKDLRDLSASIVHARRLGRPVILMMGAHVIKCGIGPLVCGLVKQGMVTGIAMNGACVIHDVEIAMWGKTSEDVVEGLRLGSFGMAAETSAFLNGAVMTCLDHDVGFGEAVGRALDSADPENRTLSIICQAREAGIPVTVHVAIGTDIVHQHADADGSAIGRGTLKDFRLFTAMVEGLSGGVVVNLGSAVIMPEVFLKALAVTRSRGIDLGHFTTANFDMIGHYRPAMNIIERPASLGATAYSFLGNHEILLPVFILAVLSGAESDGT
jgi:hypothetical protein